VTRAWSDERKGEPISAKVFVGNLSFDTTQDELKALFSQVAEVVSTVVPTDRDSGRPRGFAFVEYSDDEQAAAAIKKFDGFELGGRKLRVNEAGERPPRTRFAGPPRGGPGPMPPDDRFSRPPRAKGSRRNLRARKRSIW